MAIIAILCGWHVVRILDQFSGSIARQRQKTTDMAAFAAVGNGAGSIKVNIRHKIWCRPKIACIGRISVVAHITIIQGRNMIDFLAYGPDRHKVAIAAMA